MIARYVVNKKYRSGVRAVGLINIFGESFFSAVDKLDRTIKYVLSESMI